MAEQEDNWFGSWFNAAKDRSSKVLEFVKKDLEEFGNAVKSEASSVVSSTGTVLERTLKLDSPDSTASSMKRSFSSFLGQMNTVLNPSPDDSDTEAILITQDSEGVTLTKLQRAIYDLQKSDTTFTEDPDKELEDKFNCWLNIVADQLSEERVGKHLQSSVVLKSQYEKLVPEQVSHNSFWKRYLFKKAYLEDDIAHKEAMEKKERKEKSATDENVKWEKEDFAPYIELSEEEQIRLLQEYENEIKRNQEHKSAEEDSKGDFEEDVSRQEEEEEEETTSEIAPTSNKFETKGPTSPNKSLVAKVVDSTVSSENVSSNSSTDGDWEKISDVEK